MPVSATAEIEAVLLVMGCKAAELNKKLDHSTSTGCTEYAPRTTRFGETQLKKSKYAELTTNENLTLLNQVVYKRASVGLI